LFQICDVSGVVGADHCGCSGVLQRGEVELKVNGVSKGTVKPDDVKVARWQGIVLKLGKNLVEVRAQGPSGVITDACEWVLTEPAHLSGPGSN
jgi:hypothetical protein